MLWSGRFRPSAYVPDFGNAVVGTDDGTSSRTRSSAQTMPSPVRMAPKNRSLASFGTSRTTSYFVQSVVPRGPRFGMLSKARAGVVAESTRIQRPAHPEVTSLVRNQPERRTRLPFQRSAEIHWLREA